MKLESVTAGCVEKGLKENVQKKIKKVQNKNKLCVAEFFAEKIFCLCAAVAVICVLLIMLFIFKMGLPAIVQIGLGEFVTGTKWYPDANVFGILPMIAGSIYTTLGACLLGVPIGIMTAVFICEYAPKRMERLLSSSVELLAGIPSVVFGFFGLVVIVPYIEHFFGGRGAGSSLLAACILLGIMILPTIITTTSTALLAVPAFYREGAYALGATKIHTVATVLLPAAKSGVFSGIVLGIGRAIGETMAVILVAGNATILPQAITDPVRTMTANIAIEMGYSYGLHQQALFATGVVLFVFIMALNSLLHRIQKKEGR